MEQTDTTSFLKAAKSEDRELSRAVRGTFPGLSQLALIGKFRQNKNS
jgi:hypothetical protein